MLTTMSRWPAICFNCVTNWLHLSDISEAGAGRAGRLPGGVTERNLYATVQRQPGGVFAAGPGPDWDPFTDANVIFARWPGGPDPGGPPPGPAAGPGLPTAGSRPGQRPGPGLMTRPRPPGPAPANPGTGNTAEGARHGQPETPGSRPAGQAADLKDSEGSRGDRRRRSVSPPGLPPADPVRTGPWREGPRPGSRRGRPRAEATPGRAPAGRTPPGSPARCVYREIGINAHKLV